jgi:RND family efflux transporter MFP subunit
MKRNSKAAMAATAVAVALAAFALSIALPSCARKASLAAKPPRAVSAVAAEKRDFVLSSEYSARIAPLREINITPKVGGRVASVLVEVGMAVSRGQSLLTLDASDFESQYRQASAALGSAKAALTRTSDSGQEQQTIQAQSAADQARVAYDEAKSAYDRTKRLYDAGSVPRQTLEDVEARYKAAEIQRDAAAKALSLVRDKAGTQASDIASSQVDQASAQAELAKSQLDEAVIRSPIAGRVSYRNVEAGEMVGTSTLVFVVIDESSVIAETWLSERIVGGVAKGMRLELEIPALQSAVADGKKAGIVDSVSPAADPRSMLYEVRILVPNPDGALKGGMLARVRVPVETRPGAILVPERSTFSENGADYVLVVSPDADGGDRVAMRRVTLGESDGSSVEALDGISPGEMVVSAGQEFLGDGDKVTIVP